MPPFDQIQYWRSQAEPPRKCPPLNMYPNTKCDAQTPQISYRASHWDQPMRWWAVTDRLYDDGRGGNAVFPRRHFESRMPDRNACYVALKRIGQSTGKGCRTGQRKSRRMGKGAGLGRGRATGRERTERLLRDACGTTGSGGKARLRQAGTVTVNGREVGRGKAVQRGERGAGSGAPPDVVMEPEAGGVQKQKPDLGHVAANRSSRASRRAACGYRLGHVWLQARPRRRQRNRDDLFAMRY